MSKARLKDVAALAGVSQGTVSNVYNKPELVTEAMRAQVLEAAEKLGYTGPQPAARLLRSGKAGLIALLTDESAAYFVADAYGRRLLAGAASACDAAGVGLTIVGENAVSERPGGWSLENAIADGFVLHCFEEQDAIFARLSKRSLPYISIDGGRRGGAAAIGIDDEAAAESAMAHLTGLGHRRIGILSLELTGNSVPGPLDTLTPAHITYKTAEARLKGYRRAAERAGLAPGDLRAFETHNDEASVTAGVAHLMDRADPPTAIAAMSDVAALMAIADLRARGLSVPGDVSVIGFDGVAEGAYADPPLTTILQPAEEKGAAAVEMLLGKRPARDLVLQTELILRASTAPPPG